MSEKYFFIVLSIKNRLQVWMKIEKGLMADFLVQLEHGTGDEWKQIVRYNYAHGFPHRDVKETNKNLFQNVNWCNEGGMRK